MQLANLWAEEEDMAKTVATYQAALTVIGSFKHQMDLKVMEISCYLALTAVENEAEHTEAAKEYVRQAIRAELGKDITESNVGTFLKAEKPHQVIHTAFAGSQVVQFLTAMGEEELLAVALEEQDK
jgi:hypothetical protein